MAAALQPVWLHFSARQVVPRAGGGPRAGLGGWGAVWGRSKDDLALPRRRDCAPDGSLRAPDR